MANDPVAAEIQRDWSQACWVLNHGERHEMGVSGFCSFCRIQKFPCQAVLHWELRKMNMWKRRAERWKAYAAIYRMALKVTADQPTRWDYRQLLRFALIARPEPLK